MTARPTHRRRSRRRGCGGRCGGLCRNRGGRLGSSQRDRGRLGNRDRKDGMEHGGCRSRPRTVSIPNHLSAEEAKGDEKNENEQANGQGAVQPALTDVPIGSPEADGEAVRGFGSGALRQESEMGLPGESARSGFSSARTDPRRGQRCPLRRCWPTMPQGTHHQLCWWCVIDVGDFNAITLLPGGEQRHGVEVPRHLLARGHE